MKAVRLAAAAMLGVCSLSCILFAAELALITGQIESFGGETGIAGVVEDQDGRSVTNVTVACGGFETLTDEKGGFSLEGIDQGKIEIELYKDGYVGLRAGLIAYPDEKRWIGDATGPNDLKDDPFVLYSEIEWEIADKADDVSVEHSGEWTGESTLEINIQRDDVEGAILIVAESDGNAISEVDLDANGSKAVLFLAAGMYNISILGREILDRGLTDLEVKGQITYLNVSASEQSFFEYGIEQDVSGNYLLAAIYAVLGIACAAGAYLALRTDQWIALIIICIASFFGRSPVDLMGVNVLPLFSMASLVLAIMLRGEMVRNRIRPFRPRPSD